MTKTGRADDIFTRAVTLHRSGQLAQAIDLYQKVVRITPRNAAALNLLGLANFQSGQVEQGASFVEKALALDPDIPGGFYNLGQMLQTLGRHDDAARRYEQAVAKNPGDVQALNNLGVALKTLGKLDAAIEQYRKALARKPDYADARFNLANALQDSGQHEEAIAHFKLVITQRPDFAAAYLNCGQSLQALGRHEDAVGFYQRVIAFNPYDDAGHFNLGNAFMELRRYEDAIGCFQRALAIHPDGKTYINLAHVFQAADRDREAIESFDRAIALEPQTDEFRGSKGLLVLSLGQFADGWDLAEQRWGSQGRVHRPYPQPRWDGTFVDGPLLVWAEQGLGDQIIYSSMIEELLPRAREVIIESKPRLVDLFARSFPKAKVVEYGAEIYGGEVAAHAPLGSIGKFLRTKWEDFPKPAKSFLVADPERTRELRRRLDDGRLVIGLSWHSYNAKVEKSKSAPLIDFAPILKLPSCRFVDLQYGDTQNDRAMIARELNVEIDHLDDIDNTNDIDGLAALISACDMIVTVSNTTAHLAGALGARTVVLVPHGISRMWYWFKDRTDSPWYPNLTLRRQKRGQPWADLISPLANEISEARHGFDRCAT